MAGGAQGGRPAQNQGMGAQGAQGAPQAAPQFNPGTQQFQQVLQDYRQQMGGMSSQYPGANMAAPGGGMPQGQNMADPYAKSAVILPGQNMAAPGGGMSQQQFGMTKPAVMPMAPEGQNAYGGMGQYNPGAALPSNVVINDQALPYNPNPQGPEGQTGGVMPMAPGGYMGQTGGPMPQAMGMDRMQDYMGQFNPYADLAQYRQQWQDPRMQQNPGMTPRASDMMPRREERGRPQIEGNPNAMPMQRPQRMR